MRNALVVGGNSGVGLSVAINLLEQDYDNIYIVGKDLPKTEDIPAKWHEVFSKKVHAEKWNLFSGDFSVFEKIEEIDTLIITCGFGRVALFEDLLPKEVDNLIACNMAGIIKIIGIYYPQIAGKKDFYTLVMGSIAGHICSPFFSVYGAAKMGLCGFIENINVELCAKGCKNRILDVSPGNIKNTQFGGGKNDIEALLSLTQSMLQKMWKRETLYIPDYDNIYKKVIERYHTNALQFGVESYQYKKESGRLSGKPQLVIGYLSGTFDLFHIGHLNLLRRAKTECDYLIVGVHKDGSWKGKETFIPYEERVEILKACKYVDQVVQSFPEDSDAYDAFHIHKLFVGSDYKGTERFERYEAYFSDKNTEIIYFPYTKGTSSTQLRGKLQSKKE